MYNYSIRFAQSFPDDTGGQFYDAASQFVEGTKEFSECPVRLVNECYYSIYIIGDTQLVDNVLGFTNTN